MRKSTLPTALSDEEFWSLIEGLSEPAGEFTLSENLVSNEPHFAERVRRLSPAGGAYIGVGPEQNFSYIARLQPAMAFIIDIRRENRNLHLLYKALFDLSADRAEFISRLFSRPRPDGLGPAIGVQELFARYDAVRPSDDLYVATVASVRDRLLHARGFPLEPTDLDWIERALRAFCADGPEIHFWGSQPGDSVRPSYRQLMTSLDLVGHGRSYLASEEAFSFVKSLHLRNLIVPVVGDFGGPTAIRRVGQYIRRHGDVIHAFYGSNVAVYLTNQEMRAFCRSLATLPVASRAWFIESNTMRLFAARLRACPAHGE